MPIPKPCVLALLLACAACQGAPHRAAPRRVPTPAPVSHAPTVAIDRDAALAFVSRWLDAQNRGDFEAYRALYAPAFTGVKRTMRRTRRFDREGWLEDRARMFRRPMQVSASEIQVLPQAEGAVLSFRQRWSSGSYADEGTKRMQLVLAEGKPAVRFEELLPPTRVSEAEITLDSGVMLVTQLSDRRAYVVLGRAPAGLQGGPIHSLGLGHEAPHFAAREVDRAQAGALARILDEPVFVVTAEGPCEARVKALRMVRGAEWMDPSMVSEEIESDEGEVTYGPIDPRRVWELSAFGGGYGSGDDGRPWLVGELEAECAWNGGLAVRNGVPMPQVLAPDELPFEEAKRYVAAYADTPGGRATEQYAGHPRGFLATLLDRPMAIDVDDSAYLGLSIVRYGHGAGASTLLGIESGGSCGGDRSIQLVIGSADAPTFVDDGYPSGLVIRGVFDLEGDGVPEVIGWSESGGQLSLVRLGPTPGILRRFTITIEACDC